MATNIDSDMSELEREIELEMDEELGADEELEGLESETDDHEFEDTMELDEESDFGEEGRETGQEEFEGGESGRDQEYVERFLEIASREFESEAEVDQAMNEVLNGLSREYFFGNIFKKVRKLRRTLGGNKLLRSLIKKGLSVASGQFPALKAALQLAKGNLQGALLNLGKQALSTAISGGGAALGRSQGARIRGNAGSAGQPRRMENYVKLSREAFEHLADNVTESADQPLEASRLASNALQQAIRRAQARAPSRGRRITQQVVVRPGQRVVRHHVRPGERIVIAGGRKIIIKGT